MPHYFYVLPARQFLTEIQPSLAATWKARTFEPCRRLCEAIQPVAEGFALAHHIDPDTLLINRVAQGATFSKDTWRSVVGDLLIVCASMIPEIQTTPRTLSCLLAGKAPQAGHRSLFTPIEQVHYGTHDLCFGTGFYRPEHAGFNDQNDVARLANYLLRVDATTWRAEQLCTLEEIEADDREEELDFARQCLRQLTDVYRFAREGHVIVCEVV